MSNQNFSFPDKIDSVRSYLAIAFVLFSSSLFIGVSVLTVLRTQDPQSVPGNLKEQVVKVKVVLMGAFLGTGFLFLYSILIEIGLLVIGAVGAGFMFACFAWLIESALLDEFGGFGGSGPLPVYKTALEAALKASDRISDPQNILMIAGVATNADRNGGNPIAVDLTVVRAISNLVAMAVAIAVAEVAAKAIIHFQKPTMRYPPSPEVVASATSVVKSTALATANKVIKITAPNLDENILGHIARQIASEAAESAVRTVIENANKDAVEEIAFTIAHTARVAIWKSTKVEQRLQRLRRRTSDAESLPETDRMEEDVLRELAKAMTDAEDFRPKWPASYFSREAGGLSRFESYFRTTFRFSMKKAFTRSDRIGVFICGIIAVLIGVGTGVVYSMQKGWAD